LEQSGAPDVGTPAPPGGAAAPPGDPDGRSDLRVVLQFFIVPLSLVVVLVGLFFGLQVLRTRRPDPGAALRDLESYEGFLARYIGDFKRWQSGYDLSLLLRSEPAPDLRAMLPHLATAFREAGARGDVRLRQYLALALGHAADPRGIGPLREGMGDADPPTRLFSAWGLMQIGTPDVLADLRAAAADPDPGVRKLSVFALGRLGDRQSAGVLRGALRDGAIDVRWNAALSLARLGDPAGAPILVELLEGSLDPAPAGEDAAPPEEPRLRVERALNAIRGLALLGPPEGGAALARAAGSSDPGIAEAARAALDASGSARPRSSP
jgi:HEAT repeat protein